MAETALQPSGGRRFIYLDRRVCSVTPERIDVHPARSIIILPLLTLALGLAIFPAIFFWSGSMALSVRFALTLVALFLVPLSGLGVVYSIAGAHVVIEKAKQSAVLQQGYLGMGVGTQELVPFWKIDCILIEEALPDEKGYNEDFAQYEVIILKLSEKRVSVGTLTVLRADAEQGIARAYEIADLIAEMSGSKVETDLPRPAQA